jgi:zinc protease
MQKAIVFYYLVILFFSETLVWLYMNKKTFLLIFSFACLLTCMLTNNTFAQRETPPPPAAPRVVTIPKPVERTLKNGLRVIVVERQNLPLVTANLLIKSGGEVDPENLSGLANMTAQLLTKGTKTRTATQIAEEIESLGGSINANAAWDSSNVSVAVTSDKIDKALAVVSDVVRNPAFKDDEIERLREQLLDEINLSMSDPGSLVGRVAARVIFGDTPYGHPLIGTAESVKEIKRENLTAMHTGFYRPEKAVLIMVGDIKPVKAFALAQKLFGAWRGKRLKLLGDLITTLVSKESEKRRVVVVDMPNAGQAAVTMVKKSIRRNDADFVVSRVANSVFGGGYSSRLNQEVRIKRGLSYGAGSSISARRDVGPFSARTQTKNQSGAEVASLLISELKRLATDPIPSSELTPRKAALIGDFGRELETNAGLTVQISELALYGLPLNQINTYIQSVQAVTEADIHRFAKTHLNADGANIVIVGDAKLFLDDLKKAFPNVELIPVDELDLNSASLRKPKTSAMKAKGKSKEISAQAKALR